MNAQSTLLISLIWGSFGLGYFVYGKKQQRAVPLLSGLALMGFPYFVSNLVLSIVIGVALLASPFLIDR